MLCHAMPQHQAGVPGPDQNGALAPAGPAAFHHLHLAANIQAQAGNPLPEGASAAQAADMRLLPREQVA